MEDLKASISKLNGKLRNFVNNLTKSGQQLQNMFASFIEVCIIDINTLSVYVASTLVHGLQITSS